MCRPMRPAAKLEKVPSKLGDLSWYLPVVGVSHSSSMQEHFCLFRLMHPDLKWPSADINRTATTRYPQGPGHLLTQAPVGANRPRTPAAIPSSCHRWQQQQMFACSARSREALGTLPAASEVLGDLAGRYIAYANHALSAERAGGGCDRLQLSHVGNAESGTALWQPAGSCFLPGVLSVPVSTAGVGGP